MAASADAITDNGPGARLWRAWTVALPAAIFVALCTTIPTIAGGTPLRWAVPWIPGLGIDLSFWLDGLSLLFGLLISGIGALVFLYAGRYMAGHERRGRFLLYLQLFMASMLGLVLADNLITLFVFWELTTVTSYLLIGFDHTNPKARRNALQALLVTATGGLALLAGAVLLGLVGGTYEISELATQAAAIKAHPLYLPILILFLAGAFTKSAQFPFSFWLPNAMAAPTPVSAYLHSATMVKAGVYLLARMSPTLGGTEVWSWTLIIAGGITAVLSAMLALRQTDLKMLLAQTTVTALGKITLFLGIGTTAGVTAAVAFILAHSLYKGAMFLCVGSIDHGTGTRDVRRLRGLAALMPLTAAAAGLAALSKAGIIPFYGFGAKELMYEAAVNAPLLGWFAVAAALTANALMFAAAAIIALRPFLGETAPTPTTPHEAPVAMFIGPLTLAALGLVFGLALPWVGTALIIPGASAVAGAPIDKGLYLWHGFNIPLLLSVITVALGVLIYRGRDAIAAGLTRAHTALRWDSEAGYDRVVGAMLAAARWQTDILQSGSQRRYVAWVFATMTLMVGGTLIFKGADVPAPDFTGIQFQEWGIIGAIVVATLLTLRTQSRLTAILALGMVGIGVALIFLMFSAPDVAKTQLLVETLVVVIVAVVLLKLPPMTAAPRTAPGERVRNAVLAIAAGGVTTAMMLAVTAGGLDTTIPDWFAANSVPGGHGGNIVNVILVDFRALDTLGEILVVAMAGLAAYALVRLRPGRDSR